jgi:hypothetical protein
VSSGLFRGFQPFRCADVLLWTALAAVAPGCGSSVPPTGVAAKAAGKGPAEVLKPEQLWKYEGEGKDKRKVPISRRERIKLLHEAQNKSE